MVHATNNPIPKKGVKNGWGGRGKNLAMKERPKR